MEIIIYLLAVLITALSISVFLLIRKIKEERSRSNNLYALIKASDIYTLTWSTDFAVIEPNKPLKSFLDHIGCTADEGFLKSLFLENDSLGTTGSVLLVGAMAKDGRKTAFTLPDGSVRYILWKSKIVKTGDCCSVVATTGTDVTDEHAIRKELDDTRQQQAIANEKLEVAAESGNIGMMTITHTALGYEISISDNGLSMLGENKKDIAFENFCQKLSAGGKNAFTSAVHRLFSNETQSETVEFNIKISKNEAHHFVLRMRNTKCSVNNLNRITAAFIDVTNEHENLNLYDKIAKEDPLTGFYNRNGFFAGGAVYLENAAKENLGIVMMSIIIDRYQKISTLFGMETADRLVLTYSEGIEKCADENSVFGKTGPDTFALIMPCENMESCESFAKNLTLFIENACNGKILPAILTEQSRFTAGACFFDGADDVVTLYNKANIMLFTDCSDTSKICRYFNKEAEEKIFNRDTVEDELRSAIKNGELELYYQPKMCFRSSEICGVEALIRWNHPVRGLISPISFIPIAEEAGLITQIDEWGLTEACRQAKSWQDKGYKPIRVSVNMSQAQLYQTDVVSSIKQAVSKSGINPKQLEVELTETMAMQDIDRTISILKELQAMGVWVSMDDFGTGYSSLSALKLLPINVLKIDRSLIYDIGINNISYSIVKTIVELGRALNLEVLAEGVETKEQSRLLNELGCSVAQGYLYAKPLTAADIEKTFLEKTLNGNS